MSEPFVGEIRMFAGNFAPRSWALCDGQLLAVSQNDALFSLLGTVYPTCVVGCPCTQVPVQGFPHETWVRSSVQNVSASAPARYLPITTICAHPPRPEHKTFRPVACWPVHRVCAFTGLNHHWPETILRLLPSGHLQVAANPITT